MPSLNSDKAFLANLEQVSKAYADWQRARIQAWDMYAAAIFPTVFRADLRIGDKKLVSFDEQVNMCARLADALLEKRDLRSTKPD